MPQDMPPVGGYGDVQYKVRFSSLAISLCVWEGGVYSDGTGGDNETTTTGATKRRCERVGKGKKKDQWTIGFGI